MDISAYKAFLAVSELGTFSKAAEALFITQPAISKRIALLEDQLGSKLFDRIGKRVPLRVVRGNDIELIHLVPVELKV